MGEVLHQFDNGAALAEGLADAVYLDHGNTIP